MALLTMVSMGAWAQIDVQIANDGKFDGGTIKYVDQTKPDEKGFVTVTITVTPNKEKGYTIKKGDISVYSTLSPSGPNAGTRAPEIADNLTLYFKGSADADTDDLSAERDYTFNVPSGFGAWVKEATFQPKNRDGAKSTTDYSGVYYIGTAGYKDNTPTSNYYLCPTEGWIYYQPTNKWSADGTTYPNPFLTTYKCKTNDYHSGDASNAVWYVEKHPNQNYYYIRHASDDKYLMSNGQISGTSNANRMRVHLEEVTGNLDDKALFSIKPNSTDPSYLVISPKSSSGWNGNDYKWYTVNNGNKDDLKGNGSNGGPTGYTSTGGIIGLYTEGDANAKFYLENATIDQPTITNNFNGTVTIIAETGATIYYTTDGTKPTTSIPNYGTTSVTVILDGTMEVIKAIAKGGNDYFPTLVTTYNIPKCPKPTFTQVDENHVTISCSVSGATITYGVDSDPTNSYTTGTQIDISTASFVKAKAISAGYLYSDVASFSHQEVVHNSAEIDNMNGNYLLSSDFVSTSAIGTSSEPFQGIIDGQFYTIHKTSALGHPLVAFAEGATIKNVIVGSLNITSGTDVGAICGEADGNTRIYNCGVLSGSVSGSGNVGGLVGHIKSGSSVRVINCYNYADVNSTGDYAAGIVGYNEGTVGDVRIALCMMYGNVTNAQNISPVYAGNHESNSKNFTEYNFWLFHKTVINETTGKEEVVKTNLAYTAFNDQLAIDKEEYLTRFPFYRHILNTHRELAAYFLFANNTKTGNVSDITSDQVDEIGHWAVKKGDNAHKYPIIEPWEKNRKSTPTQTNNNLPNTTADYAGKLLTTMGNNGYLSVSIKIGSNSYSASLPITDMDTLRYDYTYGKVILPFANEYEINEDYSKICTGWKITKVGSSESSSVTNYNFADRDNLQKDIYNESTNPFIYAQGGYYIVSTGVSSIEITANFATAYYLSDETYEIGYDSSYGDRTGLGGNVPSFHGYTVYNNLATAVSNLGTGTYNPHKQAIVLVGNYHYDLAKDAIATGKGFTLMSIDADNNQEPDYGFYSIAPERPQMPALRFDFLPIISLGMAAKVNESYYYPGVPVWKSRGWYEQTETTVSIMNQFELDSGNFKNDENGKGQNPCIINGGYFVQMIRTNKTNCSKVSYFKIGGNAYIKEFYPGAHSNTTNITTTIVPVNVTGGQVEECFMTGYRSGGKAIGSDIRFWCSGGKIGKFLGAYMDTPFETSSSTNENPGTVNMTAQIDHALISRFFGGGTSKNATITGNIKVTINNSKVDFYCGGPEFGDMKEGKTVETTANNTKFGEYYGAGFGGTSITYSPKDGELTIGPSVLFSGYTYNTSRLTNSGSMGLATCYKFEFLMHSFNKNRLVARFITGYADFSLATTGNVTNNLTGCTVENDFYGAGCQGKVGGTVTSTLTNCTIKRSAFGGGYKAESNEVEVYPAAAPTLSTYNGETGIFSEFGTTTPETFTWEQGDGDNPTADDANDKLYTSKNVTLTDLGNVTGAISITINGGYVGGTSGGITPVTAATATSEAIPAGGNVYGGGNESKSLSDTTVTLKGNAVIYGDVFGGGNKAEVGGTAKVNIMYEEE